MYVNLIISVSVHVHAIIGVFAYSGLSHNRVAWPYAVSTVNCSGSEAQLLNCAYSTHFAECGQAEAAYVHCQPSKLYILTSTAIQ